MRRFLCFFRVVAAVAVVALLGACSAPRLPFIGEKEKSVKGFTPLTSSGLSTTKDLRADVVKLLMDGNDVERLRRAIKELNQGSELNWTNGNSGNLFTVRAIEPRPEPGPEQSRKVVVWGRKRGSDSTMVMTYRYRYNYRR